MERKPLLGGSQGYVVAACGTFQTVSPRTRVNRGKKEAWLYGDIGGDSLTEKRGWR
jgi:hypothetical protein